MIKKAINFLLEEDENAVRLDINSWRLTDSEITYHFLLKHGQSREIMQRVLLCRPFACLGIFYIKGDGVSAFINNHLRDIEEGIRGFLMSKTGKDKISDPNFFDNHPVFANFYPDKRKRLITNRQYFWNQLGEIREEEKIVEGVLLGIFTSYGNNYYTKVESA